MAFSMNVDSADDVKKEVEEKLAPTEEVKTQMRTQADENAQALFEVDLGSLEDRRNLVSSIENFGSDIVARSTQKNQLLETRLVDLSKMGGESGTIVNGLSQLQAQMKDLDPSGINFGKTGFLGRLTNPVKAYFAKYEKADEVIGGIMDSLSSGKAVLKNDNTTLEVEQLSLRDLTLKLNKQIELGNQMDEAITKAVEKARVENMDDERIKFVEEEILFPLRQKIMDLQQIQAVNMQGIVAMEVVRRNNKELIRAVERAENVTVSALRIAVTVAGALYNQQIVLEKVNAVNEATNELISATSKMLKQQGADIQKKAMESSISIDTLKEAFSDTFEALDEISSYKSKALPQMRTTIDQFKELAAEGEQRIQQIESAEDTARRLGSNETKVLKG